MFLSISLLFFTIQFSDDIASLFQLCQIRLILFPCITGFICQITIRILVTIVVPLSFKLAILAQIHKGKYSDIKIQNDDKNDDTKFYYFILKPKLVLRTLYDLTHTRSRTARDILIGNIMSFGLLGIHPLLSLFL